jgi:hypothetical protein
MRSLPISPVIRVLAWARVGHRLDPGSKLYMRQDRVRFMALLITALRIDCLCLLHAHPSGRYSCLALAASEGGGSGAAHLLKRDAGNSTDEQGRDQYLCLWGEVHDI